MGQKGRRVVENHNIDIRAAQSRPQIRYKYQAVLKPFLRRHAAADKDRDIDVTIATCSARYD